MKLNGQSERFRAGKVARWPLAILVLALLSLLVGGAQFYRYQKQALRKEVEKDLTAVAQLKVDQIAARRQDQLHDAGLLAEMMQPDIARFINHPSPAREMELRSMFSYQAGTHDYDEILLVGPDGEELLSLAGTHSLYSDYLPALEAALQLQEPVLLDLHADSRLAPIHTSVIVPLMGGVPATSPPAGALILITDGSTYLFPLLQSWPTPSRTGETFLVRQEGENVRFLNELRYHPDAALNLIVSLDQDHNPAVMAVKGITRFVEGIDYRGVEVAAVLLPIAETPWYMVSKMDAEEAFAEWKYQTYLLIALLLAVVVLAGSAGLLLRQWERKAHFQKLYETEAELRSVEKHHSTIVNSIGDAVIATDAEGLLELLNPAAERLTGWLDRQARGKSLDDVFVVVDSLTQRPVPSPAAQIRKSGKEISLSNHLKLTSKTGQEFQISGSVAPVVDKQGVMTGMVLAIQDVTESYEMRRELQRSEQRYRELVETTSSISWEYHIGEDAWTYVSPQTASILGWDPADWKDLQFWVDRLHPEDREQTRDHCLACTQQGLDHQLEYRFRHQSGEYLWLRAVVVVEIDQGAPVKLRGVMFDITPQKQTEIELRSLKESLEEIVARRTAELEEKIKELDRSEQAMLFMIEDLNHLTAELRQKTESLELANQELEAFSYSVSHDLKAPLRAISGFAKFLAEDYGDRIDQEGQRLIRVIRQSVAKMDHLIADLLNLSRISRAEMSPHPVDMGAVVSSIYHELASQAQKEAFKLIVHEMPTVTCDLSLIKQVWQNLISNALKYSSRSRVKRIEIGADKTGEDVVFFIRDHGAGFDPRYQHKMFEVFQRLHREDEYEGTGIGLAIIKRIIQRHGGKVWAESEIDRGAVFYFSLPRQR